MKRLWILVLVFATLVFVFAHRLAAGDMVPPG